MNYKVWLRGFAAGMVLSSILFAITTSDEDVPEKADDAGSVSAAGDAVIYPEDQVMYTEDQVQEKLKVERERVLAEIDVNHPSQMQSIVAIQNGVSAQEVSSMLEQVGLIEDQTSFLSLMQDMKLISKIKVGVYTFNGEPTEVEILQKIVGQSTWDQANQGS